MVNEAVQALIDELFPLAEIVTPNLAEAEVLASMSISTAEEVEQAAELIADRCVAAAVASPRMSDEPHVPAILIKGGHLLPASHASEKKLAESGEGEAFAENVVASDLSTPDSASATANDYLRLSRNEGIWLKGARVETSNTHGTGCSLSSAIACNLAQGYSVDVAVRNAKAYVTGALASGLDLGKGSGPLNHMWQYGPVPC
jgi:hydroxymethylpyrimidine/phosphomethylpyrimidine kinase